MRHPVLLTLVVLSGLSVLCLAIGAPISLITQIAIYTLYGAGVCLLVSYTGLVPFGASVFFGCATYAVAFELMRGVPNEIVALAFAVIFSLLLAAVIAAIILRRRGLYFSLLTLAFSQIAFEIAYKWTDVTGGENGMQGVPRPMLDEHWSFHVFAVVTVAIGLALLWRIAHSPFGRSLQALRDNEQRAQSLGYDTFWLKFASFVLMGGFIGYSGGLLALMLRGAYADNLSWQHNAEIRVKAGTSMPIDRSQRRATADKAAQQAMIDPLSYWEIMDEPNAQKFAKRVVDWTATQQGNGGGYMSDITDEIFNRDAYVDIELIKQGTEPPYRDDLDKEYFDFLNQYILSGDLENPNISPEINQAIAAFIDIQLARGQKMLGMAETQLPTPDDVNAHNAQVDQANAANAAAMKGIPAPPPPAPTAPGQPAAKGQPTAATAKAQPVQ